MPAIRVRARSVEDGTLVDFPSIAEAAQTISDANMKFKTRLNHIRIALDSNVVVDGRTWTKVVDASAAPAPVAPEVTADPPPPGEGMYMFPEDESVHPTFRGKSIRWVANPTRFRANDVMEVVAGLRSTSISMRALVIAQPVFFHAHTDTHRFYGQGNQPALVLDIPSTLQFIGLLHGPVVKLFRETTLARFTTDIHGEMVAQPPPAPTFRSKIQVVRTSVNPPNESTTFANANAAALSVMSVSGYSPVHTRIRVCKAIRTGEAFAGFTWRNLTVDSGRRRLVTLCGGIVAPVAVPEAAAGGSSAMQAEEETAEEPENVQAEEETAEENVQAVEEETAEENVQAEEETAEENVQAVEETAAENVQAVEETAAENVQAEEETAQETNVAPTHVENNLVDSLVAEHGGQIIAEMRASDGYVNATKMCQAGGKRWHNYIKNEDTKRFLTALSRTLIRVLENLVISSNGGSHAGTWVHPQVAIHLASWISPTFAVAVTRLVLRYTSGQVTTAESNATSIAVNNRVTVVADVPPVQVRDRRFRLLSVTGFIDLRAAQVYAREVIGRFRSVYPHGRPQDVLTFDQMTAMIIVKFGCQGEQTGRQEAHTHTFLDSKLVDSFPTRSYSFVEQRLKDILANRTQLYEGVYENKSSKDTELLVFRTQAEYVGFVELVQQLIVEADTRSTETPLELLLEREKTKQVEAEADARKVEATTAVRMAEIELETLKFRVAHALHVHELQSLANV